MSRKNEPKLLPSLADQGKASDSFLLKWPIIIITLLFIPPIGLILLITKAIGIAKENKAARLENTDKIPYARRKSKALRLKYGESIRRYHKRIVTSIIGSIIFLLAGLYGTTKLVVLMLFSTGFTSKGVADFVSFALFVLSGFYFSMSCISTVQQNSRIHRILKRIDGEQIVDVKELASQLLCDEDTVESDLRFMLLNDYFGDDAYYDPDNRIMHGWE